MGEKILINYIGVNGSGPVFSLGMAKGLAENGCDVYAIIPKNIENLDDWLNADFLTDVALIDLYTSKLDYLKHYFSYNKRAQKVVMEKFGKVIFDKSIKTFPHPMLDIVESGLSIKEKYTICHDPVPHKGEPLIARYRNYRYIHNAQKIIVLSKQYIEFINKKYGFKLVDIVYMPHGTMELYREKNIPNKLIEHKEGYVDFVFFGRVEDYKGIDILGKAYRELKKETSNISLTVAGKGDFEKYVEIYNNLEDLTLLNRYIDDSEVGNLFDSDQVVAVVPYVEASQSGVIPIALEYGRAIIATDTGGLKEQLFDGEVGSFAKPGDVESLKQAMQKLVVDDSYKKMQEQISKQYSDKLSWKGVTANLLR